jgi:uncharacterized protein YlaI
MSRAALRKSNGSGNGSCDVCNEVGFLEEHHIRGRKIQNYNQPFNIANICPNCHFKIHLGEIIIENWATSTGGRILLWHKKGEKSVTGDDAVPHIIAKKS